MKTIGISLLVIMLLAPSAFAGEVYGSIQFEGKSIGGGVVIKVKCLGGTQEAKTDDTGSYRLYVKEKGRCTLTLNFGSQTPSIGIYSYDSTVRYDLVLELRDGQYALRRR